MRKIIYIVVLIGIILVANGYSIEENNEKVAQSSSMVKSEINSEQLPQWLTAIGTVGVVVVAIFLNALRRGWQRPKIDVSFEFKPPDCHLTTMARQCTSISGDRVLRHWISADCYYFRVLVKNKGRTSAESVEIFAHTLKQKINGSYERVDSFLPMRLKWSHIGTSTFDILAPHMEKHCDIGHIIHPKKRMSFPFESNPKFNADSTVFSFDLEVQPYNYSHLIPPGNYKLELFIGASNIRKPSKRILIVDISGKWFPQEDEMFTRGITMDLS